MGSCIVVLKDDCIPMPSGVGHNDRLKDIVSVVQPSDIPLADVEFCPPSHGDPSSNCDTSNSIAVVCDHGWRQVTLCSSTPNRLLPIVKIASLTLDHFRAEVEVTELICCLNVITMISTEIISFNQYIRVLCLLAS